jgi:molybdopterin molybdotransferase
MDQKLFFGQPSCADEDGFGNLRVEQALEHMLNAVSVIGGYERVEIRQALARVLDQEIVSPLDVPSHTNSAVDGYAVRATDLPPPGQIAELVIAGTAYAGKPYRQPVESRQTVRIMTGAAMPQNTDTVLMQEHVHEQDTFIRIDDRHQAGQNVRQAGEDVRCGEAILQPGRYLTPADIGLIASLGIGEVRVKRRPRIAVFSTGDELTVIGRPLVKGKIYDSNRYALQAALKRLEVFVMDLGIVPDDRVLLEETILSAAHDADVVIASGGVSVGEADYTKAALASLGSVEFWKIAMKPGRPIAFGHVGGSVFFGLPGNPVAVMVTYSQFVLPVLQKCMGVRDPSLRPLLLAKSLERLRKKPGRTEFQRGILRAGEPGEWLVGTTGKQGSGILRSMSLANAFIVLPHERGTVEAGDKVLVQPFSQFW